MRILIEIKTDDLISIPGCSITIKALEDPTLTIDSIGKFTATPMYFGSLILSVYNTIGIELDDNTEQYAQLKLFLLLNDINYALIKVVDNHD